MNDRKLFKSLLFTILLFFFLNACGRAARGTATKLPPMPTTTPPGTKTPTWTPSPWVKTPDFTFVLTEADTDTPAWTPAAAPLSQNGPWLALHNSMALWVGNADGTGFVQIADSFHYTQQLDVAISPHHGRLVYYYPDQFPDAITNSLLNLTVVSLPSLSSKVLPLSNKALKPSPNDPSGIPFGNILAALSWDTVFAWSPDGTILAYASAQDGPSVDLYTYSPVNQSVSRLTSGPSQTIDISWSPDGHYIVSAGATDMAVGVGGGNGPTIDALWAIRPDGSDLHTVQTFPGGSEAPPGLLDWVNNQSFVEIYSELGCGLKGLTFVDIQASSHITLVPGAMGPLALNPKTGTALVLIPPITEKDQYAFCGTTPEPGVYLLSVFGSEPPKKIVLDTPDYAYVFNDLVYWSPEANLFFLANKDGVYTIDLGGKVTLTDIPNVYYGDNSFPAIHPKSSPDGREWAIYSAQGMGIASADQPFRPIFQGAVDDVLWSPDGSALYFVSDNRLYRAAVGKYPPVEIAGPIPPEDSSQKWQLEWVRP